MNRSKYGGNKLMKKLLASKKKVKLPTSDSNVNSRELIISIFTQQTEADKLQYTRAKWKHQNTTVESQLPDLSNKTIYQPMKHLFPLLESLSNGMDIDICGFLIVDHPHLHTIFNERHLKIVTHKFSAAKIKYWLSHIYFLRFRKSLAEQLVLNSKTASLREIVHSLQEKEYMPSVVRGGYKNSCPLVRKLKVSPDNRFRKQGESEKKPFCMVYSRSGTEQQLSFSEILSFLDYSFNLNEMVYIKILPNQVKDIAPILIKYSKLGESHHESEILNKYRSIYYRAADWQQMREQMEDKKISLMNKKEYFFYCRQVTLEIVAFIEVRQFKMAKRLQIQWVLDENKGIILSNVHSFETVDPKITNTFDGLETLYQKVLKEKSSQFSGRSSKLQCSARYKRFKSQQKETTFNIGKFLLPLESAQKNTNYKRSSRLEVNSEELIRKKGKSCVIRCPEILFG